VQKQKQNGSEMIRMTPGILQRIRQSLFRRAKFGVEVQVVNFEDFI